MFYAGRIQAVYFGVFFAYTVCIAQESTKLDRERTMNESIENYDIENVVYRNENANITLAGTVTKPKGDGPFPAVLIISGMGAVNRDGEMYGHKRYAVIAEYLTQNGLAVLRFDKRGVGESTGVFGMNVTCRELANDVLAGIFYLKTRCDIDPNKIGLIGHSEGGMIASLLASELADIAFVVSMAGAVAISPSVIKTQTAVQLKFDGASAELIDIMSNATEQLLNIVKSEPNSDIAINLLNNYIAKFFQNLPENIKLESTKYPFAISPANVNMKINFFNSPYYRWFLMHDADAMLSKIKVPYLALYCEKDFMAPNLMVPIVEKGLQKAGNQDYEVVILPNLNHSFQTCKTGSMTEYATIQETIAPSVLKLIGDWILEHTN